MSHHQRGYVQREHRSWRLVMRVLDGTTRRRKSWRLGTIAELPTRAAARRAADRLIESFTDGTMTAATVMTWPAWCAIYAERSLSLLAKGTWSTRQSIIDRHLIPAPAFAGLAVHEIDQAACQRFVVDQHLAGAAPSTVRTRFGVLRRVLRAAADAGIAVNPPRSHKTDFPRAIAVTASVRAKAFSPAEVDAILAAASEPLRTACTLARYAGLRCGEVLGLTWEAIDLDAGTLEVRQQALDGERRPLKSKCSAATVALPPPLYDALLLYRMDTSRPTGLLFADDKGRPLDGLALRHQLHQLLDRLGIPRRGMHGFRHACALAMAAGGVNPEALRRAMRHASLRVTAAYLTVGSEDVANALRTGSSRSHVDQKMTRNQTHSGPVSSV